MGHVQLANCCPDTTRTAPCPATLLTRLVRAHLQYKPETFEQLVYKETLSKLVHSVGYPKEVLKFELDHTYMVRGLAVDKERGNILKIDRHNYVKVAYHGWQELSSEERNATYNQAPFAMTFEEPYFALIDTLFSLGEAYLFAQLVDLIDGRPELFAEEKSYSQIYSDVREAVDLCHRDGSLKAPVADDPSKFIEDDDSLVPLFKTLRQSGRKVFLLTNSLYDYTDVVMTYLCRNYDGRWQDYFDTIVVGSRKPSFFKTSSPPFEVIPETGMLRNTDNGSPLAQIGQVGRREGATNAEGRQLHIIQGGGVDNLHSMLGVRSGSEVLYVGDHIYGDIIRSKKYLGWRTCLLIPELLDEIEVLRKQKLSVVELFQQREEADAQEDLLQQIQWKHDTQGEQLPTEWDELIERRNEARERHRASLRQHHREFHPRWGQLLKTGYQASRFAHQIERFACIYTSSVANLGLHSPDKRYRSTVDSMPHDVWP